MSESNNPYAGYPREQLILRDHLAIDRTILANERTLLAYVRTALVLVVVGGTLIKFIGSLRVHAIGALFILAGVAVFALGAWRFQAMRARIRAVMNAPNDTKAGSDRGKTSHDE